MVIGLLAASLATVAVVAATPALGEPASGVPGAPPTAAGRLDLGVFFSCAIDNAGTLSCWGQDANGDWATAPPHRQPAVATPVDTTATIPDTWTAVSAGDDHACALATDGTAWCWGHDRNGQLGNGAALTADQPSPTPVDTAGAIPDTWTAIAPATSTPAASPPTARPGAGAPTAAAGWATARPDRRPGVAVAGRHRRDHPRHLDGHHRRRRLHLRHRHRRHRLVLGQRQQRPAGQRRSLTGNQPSPSPVDTAGPIPDTWTAITAGRNNTCAIAADGTAWCWGNDSNGQRATAGLTGPQPSPSPVDTAGAIPDTWTAISAGAFPRVRHRHRRHCLVLGRRLRRPLGNGDALTGDQVSPSPVDTAGSIPDTWQAISCRRSHSCAIATDGTVWCWGTDFSGQLGNGTVITADQPSPSCAIGCGITTRASAGGPVGTAVSDTATVTGTFPTGTVTFHLFSDSACDGRGLQLVRPPPH